jgi:hypothetical protein
MGWFRSNVRSGAWCALLALAVQFALQFGHVHVDGLAQQPADAAGISAQVQAAGEPAPSDNPEDEADRHFCFVCRLIHLANGSMPGASPSLPLPILVIHVRLAIDHEREHAAPRPSHFQARAPPIA